MELKYSKLKVTNEAKQKARAALQLRESLPKSKRFGLDKTQAREAGVASGVERAKQISRSKYIPYNDAVRIARFKRFVPAETPREQGAVDLWGGDNFIKKANTFVKASNRARGYERTL
jgi:hypothetical protein